MVARDPQETAGQEGEPEIDVQDIQSKTNSQNGLLVDRWGMLRPREGPDQGNDVYGIWDWATGEACDTMPAD